MKLHWFGTNWRVFGQSEKKKKTEIIAYSWVLAITCLSNLHNAPCILWNYFNRFCRVAPRGMNWTLKEVCCSTYITTQVSHFTSKCDHGFTYRDLHRKVSGSLLLVFWSGLIGSRTIWLTLFWVKVSFWLYIAWVITYTQR